MGSGEKPSRLTIGVLVGFQIYEGSHPNPFAFPIIRGIQAAAADAGINLMVACGVARDIGRRRQCSAWPEVHPDMDFVPVGPWNTDGLIFLGPLRTSYRIGYARRLAEKNFPVLSIGGDSGKPAITVDNEGGIRQALEHLVGHGHRSIVFVAGDEEDTGDSLFRLRAFRKAQSELGLDDDPRLLVRGGHWEEGGYVAMRQVLESGVKFTAVMCSNDQSALGAVRALRNAGRRIPRDVAVAGFDDIQESLAQVPPLTSVHFPMFEAGYRALLLLRKRILQGAEALPDMTYLSTWLIPRQSCGCPPEIVAQSALDTGPSPAQDGMVSEREMRIRAMVDTILADSSPAAGMDLVALCGRLEKGYSQSLEDGDYSHFQSAFSEIIQSVEIGINDNYRIGQRAISALRRSAYAMPAGRPDSGRLRRIEDLMHLGRTMVSESADRYYTRLKAESTERDEKMGVLTARLIAASDEAGMYEALRKDLPQIGVRSCRLAFFEPAGGDPVAGSRLYPMDRNDPPVTFDTRQFPPAGLYPADGPFSLALVPLFYQDENLGYVAFDGGNLDPLATLVRQMASSIENARLHARVLDLSLTDELTGVHNRRYLEIFLQKETGRSRRYQRNLAVIMLDIDRFKSYNDRFGHPAGDDALREIARSLEWGARRGLDVVTRYGGEEFAIVLPETDSGGALVVAENVRRMVAENPAFLQPTTVSLGVSAMCGEDLRADLMVEQADRALYQAKRRGRNRTVVFESWMSQPAGSADGGAEEGPAGPGGGESRP
jgi:diguanylate cyclase (GGDEF)-like protein